MRNQSEHTKELASWAELGIPHGGRIIKSTSIVMGELGRGEEEEEEEVEEKKVVN